MSGLAIGCILSGANATFIAPAGPVISYMVLPATKPLFEGQTLAGIPSYATMVSPENFASAQGDIVTVEVNFSGDATDAATLLSEGDTAGFSVTVTDDKDNTALFTTDPVTVAYKLHLVATPDGNVDININPVVPDAESLGDIVIDVGSIYDATYTGITAGELRAAPYNFGAVNTAGLPTLSGTTSIGNTLTVDEGLWSTPDHTILTFTYQWRANGVDISGATGKTFDITASEQGTDVTVEVTGDDGVNSPVTAESLATAVPSGTFTMTYGEVGTTNQSSALNPNPDTVTYDCGAAEAGKALIIQQVYGLLFQDKGDGTVVNTFNSGALTPTILGQHSNGRFVNMQFTVVDASAGGNIALSAVPHSYDYGDPVYWSGNIRRAYLARKGDGSAINFEFLSADATPADGYDDVMDLSANVIENGFVISSTKSQRAQSTTINYVGLTADGSWGTGENTTLTGLTEDAISTTEFRTMSVQFPDVDNSTACSLLVVK